MNLSERAMDDYLRHTFRGEDARIFDVLKHVLSAREQGDVEAHVSVVAREKLAVVCNRPERLREVILIARGNPDEIMRGRLTLKRKKTRPKT